MTKTTASNRSLALFVLCLTTAACLTGEQLQEVHDSTEFGDLGLPAVVGDTGYEGTWSRGNERVRSILAIVEHEGAYRFRYTKISDDGRLRVDCGWDGQCQELIDGEPSGSFKFDVAVNEQTDRLRIECNGRIERPVPTDLFYVDELVVTKKGLGLDSWKVEDHQGSYEFEQSGVVRFTKMSNHVLDPPAGWSPRGG